MKLSIQYKDTADGKQKARLYLYIGSTTNSDGKKKHNRQYKDTGFWLYKKTNAEPEKKNHNKETKRLIDAYYSNINQKLLTGEYTDLRDIDKFKTLSFMAYFEHLAGLKTGSNQSVWISCIGQLKKFTGKEDLAFTELTPSFVQGFRDYLANAATTKSNKQLTSNTASTYFNKFREAIAAAVKDKANGFTENPAAEIAGIKQESEKREHLLISEIRKLVNTQCDSELLKAAFLFSTQTGLRWVDCQKLIWQEIDKNSYGEWQITFKQKKTGGLQYLPISNEAYELLGAREEPEEKVFKGLKYSAHMNKMLAKWVQKAGIRKHITFHCARHTFAVQLITNKTPIYEVSKLLGHTEVRTTQIYADIIDEVRSKAMTSMPSIFAEEEKIQSKIDLIDEIRKLSKQQRHDLIKLMMDMNND